MADLKMKLNTNNDLRLKMKSTENITMKFDDYQKFKEEDPIFKDSPAYTITYQDINYWNNKSDFNGNYNELYNKPDLSIYASYSYVNAELRDKVDKETGMGLSQNSFTTEEKTKLASLENYDDTAIVEALATKADISSVPTKTSDLDNDSGFITNTVDDLVNYPTTTSVNGLVAQKQNIIDSNNMLSADYVDDTTTTNKFVTASDITTWNNKSDFSGNYNDLTNKPTIPSATSELTNDSDYTTKSYVDTKGIYESGSNTNGRYIKYDDGTMICYILKENVDCRTLSVDGNYYYKTISDINFPQTFIETPVISISTVNKTNGRKLRADTTLYNTTSKIGQLIVSNYWNSNDAYVDLNITVIGRWKV